LTSNMPSITGQSIVILGGSSGIGLGVAKLALNEGVKVAIVSSNPTRVAAAVDGLKKEFPGGQIVGYDCDLRADDVEVHLEKLFTQVVAANGGTPLDHIVFTAGDPLAMRTLKEINVDFIRDAGKVRFVAPLLIAKLAPRFLKNSHTSSFIMTSGAVSQKPMPEWSVVASYSSALHGLTRNLALDLKPIRVNLVSPGAVDTELWGPNREQLVAQFSKGAFMGKIGTAEEVGESYIYFMKDTNATGSMISTNGGSLL
jgi:NAD(P)-dependent dehydrogenase (short-subunit alcohol dehydrogenase family)